MNVELSTISIKYRLPVIEKGFSLLKFQSHFYKQNKSQIYIKYQVYLYRLICKLKILSALKYNCDFIFHISFCIMFLNKLVSSVISMQIAVW